MKLNSLILACIFIFAIQSAHSSESSIINDAETKLLEFYQEYQDMTPSLSIELLQKDYEQDDCKTALGLLVNIVKKINAYQTVLQNQCPKELKTCLAQVEAKKCLNYTQYNTYKGELQQNLQYNEQNRQKYIYQIKQIQAKVYDALKNYESYKKAKSTDIDCHNNDIKIVKQIIALISGQFDYNQYQSLKTQVKSPYSRAFLEVVELYNISNVYANKTQTYTSQQPSYPSNNSYTESYQKAIAQEQRQLEIQQQSDIKQIKVVLNELLEQLNQYLVKVQNQISSLQGIYIKTLQQSKKEIGVVKDNIYRGDHKSKNYQRIVGIIDKKIQLCKYTEQERNYCNKRYQVCKQCQQHYRKNKNDLQEATQLLSQLQIQMIQKSQKY